MKLKWNWTKTAKTFHDCFSVLFSCFLFRCAEKNTCFISVVFESYFNRAGTITLLHVCMLRVDDWKVFVFFQQQTVRRRPAHLPMSRCSASLVINFTCCTRIWPNSRTQPPPPMTPTRSPDPRHRPPPRRPRTTASRSRRRSQTRRQPRRRRSATRDRGRCPPPPPTPLLLRWHPDGGPSTPPTFDNVP